MGKRYWIFLVDVMSIFLRLTVLLPNNPKKWLDGPIKYSIHNRAEFVILSVALHSDDSMPKKKKKSQQQQYKN